MVLSFYRCLFSIIILSFAERVVSVSFPVANSSVDTPESGFLPGVRRVLQQRVRCSVHSLCILNVYFCKHILEKQQQNNFKEKQQTKTIHFSVTHIYTYTHAYIHTHIHTYIHTYTHAYIHKFTHIYIYTYIHTHMHIYIHTYVRTY